MGIICNLCKEGLNLKVGPAFMVKLTMNVNKGGPATAKKIGGDTNC